MIFLIFLKPFRTMYFVTENSYLLPLKCVIYVFILCKDIRKSCQRQKLYSSLYSLNIILKGLINEVKNTKPSRIYLDKAIQIYGKIKVSIMHTGKWY